MAAHTAAVYPLEVAAGGNSKPIGCESLSLEKRNHPINFLLVSVTMGNLMFAFK